MTRLDGLRGKAFCDNREAHGPGGKQLEVVCPECGAALPTFAVAVDVLVERNGLLWLVRRKGGKYALPGGFVEFGETLEEAAVREAQEELGAREVTLLCQFHTYGDPGRDARRRTVSVVYIARVDRIEPSAEHLAADGLEAVEGVPLDRLPPLAFDHDQIVEDYLAFRRRLEPLAERRGSGS